MDIFGTLAILLLILIAIFIIVTNIRIVPQAKAYVVERLGLIILPGR
jgi:regulator of protease activity HflC (stomatin/prohibitin superfamily)